MAEHVITKVEIQKKNRERVNVYIDGHFAFPCNLELVYTFDITKGKIVDVEYLKGIVDENNYMKCKNSALTILDRTYKTEKQMRDKLAEKQYDDGTISKVIDFLKKYKFIDDSKFVELYIKEKIDFQGRNKIKYSLLKKGIGENILNEKLNSIDSHFEEKAALNMAQKKYASILKSENSVKKIYKKLGDYLIRKGYDFSMVKSVLGKVLKECGNFSEKGENTYFKKNNDLDELYAVAKKRYEIIIKSEKDRNKVYRRLGAYLMRRGYPWENIKKVLNKII
ncbi:MULTISPECIES: recombination regulator RecX [Clostridium]|uniref:Regulatory protein RecX n=1 Tax=Clostridium lapidicellarium TaxID=3240931 RepID=A0ABV4DZT3_9CLOT